MEGAGEAIFPPGPPTTNPPSNEYTAVVNKTDATDKTVYPLTDQELQENKAYYSRVRYNSAETSSEFSSYNKSTNLTLN